MNNIDELVNLLTEENIENKMVKDAVMGISSASWVEYIDKEKINLKARMVLLDIIKDESSCVPIVIRLSSQKHFGAIISNEIVNTGRWEKLIQIISDAGMTNGGDKKNIEKAMTNLISDKKIYFWFFSLLFSSSFFKALKSIIFDGESELRTRALTFLGEYDGTEVRSALVQALDDTNKDVRKLAQKLLRDKYGDEFVDGLLSEEESNLEELKQSAQEAKEKLKNVFKNLPGFSTLIGTIDRVISKVSSMSDAAATGINRGISTVKNQFSWKPKDK